MIISFCTLRFRVATALVAPFDAPESVPTTVTLYVPAGQPLEGTLIRPLAIVIDSLEPDPPLAPAAATRRLASDGAACWRD